MTTKTVGRSACSLIPRRPLHRFCSVHNAVDGVRPRNDTRRERPLWRCLTQLWSSLVALCVGLITETLAEGSIAPHGAVQDESRSDPVPSTRIAPYDLCLARPERC